MTKKEVTLKTFDQWNNMESQKNKVDDLIIFEEVTELNYDCLISKSSFKYIRDTFQYIVVELINKYGVEDYVSIKDEMRDNLIKDDFLNLFDFFGLNDKDIDEKINTLIESTKYKIKIKDLDGGFYNNYIQDDSVMRLILNMKGYVLTSDANQDTYEKRRSAILPTSVIEDIGAILTPNFNKISLLSNKNNERVGEIIILNMENIREKLLHLPYTVCDTEDTRTVLLATANQMLTLVDYLEGNKKELFGGMKEGYSSEEQFKDDGKGGVAYE